MYFHGLNGQLLDVNVQDVVLSPNGKRIGYKVFGNDGFYVDVDGSKGPEFTHLLSPVFSPDSKNFAYSAEDDDGWYVLLNHKLVFDTEDGPIVDVSFAPDGRTLAWCVEGESSRAYVVVLGRGKGASYHWVASPAFSPNGREVAYWARDAQKRFRLLVNGRRVSPILQAQEFPRLDYPVFAPDGRSTAYLSWRGEKQFYVIDNKEQPAFDEVQDFTFGVTRRDYAYVANDSGKTYVISTLLPRGRSENYQDALVPKISPDGKSLAYFIMDGERYRVVVNGEKGPLVDQVDGGSLRFSDDGRYVFYGAQNGEEFWLKTLRVP